MTGSTTTTLRRVGTTDLTVFPLGLGGNVFGMTADAPTSERILDAFIDGGGNMVDTADSYSAWVPGNTGGESETIIGAWMRRRGNRDRVIVATKVGSHPDFKGLAPDTIARAADASLQRLQTDSIDLYYAHQDDNVTPIEDIAWAFDDLVRAGKVRYVGISNLSPERIREWLRVAREHGLAVPVALQPQYNLVARRTYEESYAPIAEQEHLGVFPYFGLAAGFLTGKYRTQDDLAGAARGGSVKSYLNDDGLRVIAVLDEVARAHGTSPATVALAWLAAKPTITAPLASATSVEQLADLLAAARMQLNADEVAALDAASQTFA